MAEFEQKIRSRAQYKLLILNRIIHATRSRAPRSGSHLPKPDDATLELVRLGSHSEHGL